MGKTKEKTKKATKITSDLDDDDRPAVDGANGIIAWVNWDESIYRYATIPGGEIYDIDDDVYPNCSPEIEDGKIVMRDNNEDIWVYDVMADEYSHFDAGVDRRPQISEGIVLWLDTDSDILYYTDLSDPSGEVVQVNDDVELGEDDGWNVNISAGTVIFEGYDPAGSSTQVIFAYTVGDPTDSVEVIFTATNEDGNGVRQIDMDEDLRDRLVAEAKFLRGYFYFQLIKTFGGVPLITHPLDPDGYCQPRATMDECWAQIEEDLSDAADDLPEKSA